MDKGDLESFIGIGRPYNTISTESKIKGESTYTPPDQPCLNCCALIENSMDEIFEV